MDLNTLGNHSDVMVLVPWCVLLVVFIGMGILQWRVIGALRQALLSTRPVNLVAAAQPAPKTVSVPTTFPPDPNPVLPKPSSTGPLTPPPAPTTVRNDPVHTYPAPPKPAVSVSSPFSAPPWYSWALQEIGFHETGVNLGIERYIALAHAGSLGDPWCAIFQNAALESVGTKGTRSASSQSFRNDPNFVKLDGPALGAIAVFWRGSPTSGLGHVGMYHGENDTYLWILGGNEDDMVQIEALSKSAKSFGLIGYWWPKSYPLPKVGAIIMPSGSPMHVQTPTSTANGVQTSIVATMFGNQGSAYGGNVDDTKPGVALPYRFTGARPKVRVTKGGLSIDCDIVDVGPWNISDPYWETGRRPQAETGIDQSGRKTNKAGIDLTFAAASAIQLDGKGLVNWSFIDPNLDAIAKAILPNHQTVNLT